MNPNEALPPLEGVALAAPPGFTIKALECAATTVFAAGFTTGSDTPEVWVGELDHLGRTLTWGAKVPSPNRLDHDGEFYIKLSADPGAAGSRFAISGWDDFSISEGVRVFERIDDRWLERGRMEHPERESDIPFGIPLLLRGVELFTFESPGGQGVVHRYQQVADVWSRAELPLDARVSMLWWQLAMSPAPETLAFTAQHGDGPYHLELYTRGRNGVFAHAQSVQLPTPPEAIGATRDRFIVGLSQPTEAGANLVVVGRQDAVWQVQDTIALPPSGPPSVGNMAVGPESLVVWRGQPWLVDLATSAVTHRLAMPTGSSAGVRYPGPPLAACGTAFLAASRSDLLLFSSSRAKP